MVSVSQHHLPALAAKFLQQSALLVLGICWSSSSFTICAPFFAFTDDYEVRRRFSLICRSSDDADANDQNSLVERSHSSKEISRILNLIELSQQDTLRSYSLRSSSSSQSSPSSFRYSSKSQLRLVDDNRSLP